MESKSTTTILLVDDEYDILAALEMVFTDVGYSVRQAHDGKEGLERLAEEPLPDLIVSDIMMPVLDGYGFVKAVRAVEAYRDIPIVLLSGALLDERKILKSDYALFMRKPFSLNELLLAIEKTIASSKESA